MNASRLESQQSWGVLAQFANAAELRAAIGALQAAGFHRLEAYTPFPVEGLEQDLRLKPTVMPWIILGGGILGGVSVYALEYWINLVVYPLNIGGRPLHSWPSFIPPAFEGAVLLSSLFALVGVVLVCGLPRLNHPLFEIEAFKRASTDGFFVVVRPQNDTFEFDKIEPQLRSAGAQHVWEVPNV